jgi:hypothetical protein
MSTRKYITALALAAVLHQSVGLLFPLLPFGQISDSWAVTAGIAWAQEAAPGASQEPGIAPFTVTPPKRETETLPTTCDDPSVLESPETPPEQPAAETPLMPISPEDLRKVPEFIDFLHAELSRELQETATQLDSFFGDDRAVLEENRSYVRLRYGVFQEEAADTLFKPTVDLRLVLPQLEKKTHLVFSAEPATPTAGVPTPVTTPGEETPATGQGAAAPDERNLSTALLYFIRSVPRESIMVRTGVQLSQGKPVLFASPRYRSLVPLGTWDFRLTQEALYRTDTGWQTTTRFDFERKLPLDLFFRTSIDGSWFANTTGYFYGLSFSLRQVINPASALDYEWINSYRTRPSYELTEVAFRIRYRRSFWREWLFFELAPQLRYPRDRDFDDTPGIQFKLEMFFGKLAR